LWNLQKLLQYIVVEFTPPSFSFILRFPGIVSTGLFSIFIHVYTVFATYSPFYTLSPPPPLGTNLPGRTCSSLLFSDFVKEKK
jgi:hypothetical protein